MTTCPHERVEFRKGYCSNGAVQVREVCVGCGANVRGSGVNLPHHLFTEADIEAMPVLFDHRPQPDLFGL